MPLLAETRTHPDQAERLRIRFTVLLTEDAARRVRVEAAKRHVPMGRVISELAIKNLPHVEAA